MGKSLVSYEERTKWFTESRFGIFVHFGLYSQLARGEWVKLVERIPDEEYSLLANTFNPKHFDADKLVKLAKDAGAGYMVFTARHHDGFCLYNSGVSDYNSFKTAAKRDFVAEYVEACHKYKIKVGIYYSLLDWRFPGYFDKKSYPESFEAMVHQAHDQVRELMSGYGKIDILWYDGGWIPNCSRNQWNDPASPFLIANSFTDTQCAEFWHSSELNAMVRELQPQIIINNRSGLPEDLDTPEQHVTASQSGRVWESCMTMGDFLGWGYVMNNPTFKSTAQLIQYIVTAASGEGNYLLNIGPRPDGIVREEEVTRLGEIGKWLKVNGESIYGSQSCPFGGGMLGLTTAKGNIAYVHVFHWPGEEACIPGVVPNIVSAYILSTGKELEISYRSNGRLILRGLPEAPPDPYDTVIVLKFDGEIAAC
jgi:alpha-L-fucosidase